MYDQFKQLDTSNSSWIKSKDEPTKRVYYRREENLPAYTMLSDTILDANICHIVACFEQTDIMVDMYKAFTELKWLVRRGEANGLLYARQSMPFPLKDRDLCFHISGVGDPLNKGMITIS
jgi:hypothetical protein